jgi:dihydropyrimidinase
VSSVLIRNGVVVTAESAAPADVLIEGERIERVAAGIPVEAAQQVIDATGMLVFPGGVDAHTHLDMPLGGICSSDNFETGTQAAACGGTTTILDFATQARGTRMLDALEAWRKKADGCAAIDYGLHMIVTDLFGGGLDDLDRLVAEGVTSFKLFMAYPATLMLGDGAIFEVLCRARENGALTAIHAENGAVIDVLVRRALAEGKTTPVYHALTRPAATEGEAVHRAIALAEMADAPVYIVHVSSADGLRQVQEARERGARVFAETCPHYLLLSVDELARPGFEGAKYVLTPPLREKRHQAKLWEGLERGDLSIVATDHCPFRFEDQKALGRYDFTKIPNGGPGIEHRLELLFHFGVNEGRLTTSQFVERVSTEPARLFGLYPRKGALLTGSDADVVIWDPNAERVISAADHHMRVDYSMYEGFRVKGRARIVLSRGEVVVQDYEFVGRAGRGRYLKRTP